MNPIMIAKLATAAHKAGLDKYSLPMQIAPDFTNKVYDIADTILSDEDMKEIKGLSPEGLYKTLAKAYKSDPNKDLRIDIRAESESELEPSTNVRGIVSTLLSHDLGREAEDQA